MKLIIPGAVLFLLRAAPAADVSARNPRGETPLHWTYDSAAVAVLVAAGADVDAWDARGHAPLHMAEVGRLMEEKRNESGQDGSK